MDFKNMKQLFSALGQWTYKVALLESSVEHAFFLQTFSKYGLREVRPRQQFFYWVKFPGLGKAHGNLKRLDDSSFSKKCPV